MAVLVPDFRSIANHGPTEMPAESGGIINGAGGAGDRPMKSREDRTASHGPSEASSADFRGFLKKVGMGDRPSLTIGQNLRNGDCSDGERIGGL